jgi:ABC-type transport system involved in Fe-S cluster assembly fused permease/ATPase subunit
MNKLILISLVIVFAICSKSWAVEFYPLPKESKAPEPETHIKEQLSFSANKILKEGKIIHKTFDDKLQRYNFLFYINHIIFIVLLLYMVEMVLFHVSRLLIRVLIFGKE